MIEAAAERWRRLTVKEGWRGFVDDEPTERPEHLKLGNYRRLDERARGAYDLERLRHAHGFGPIRSLYTDIHRALERLVCSNELRGPGARGGAALDGNPGNGARRCPRSMASGRFGWILATFIACGFRIRVMSAFTSCAGGTPARSPARSAAPR